MYGIARWLRRKVFDAALALALALALITNRPRAVEKLPPKPPELSRNSPPTAYARAAARHQHDAHARALAQRPHDARPCRPSRSRRPSRPQPASYQNRNPQATRTTTPKPTSCATLRHATIPSGPDNRYNANPHGVAHIMPPHNRHDPDNMNLSFVRFSLDFCRLWCILIIEERGEPSQSRPGGSILTVFTAVAIIPSGLGVVPGPILTIGLVIGFLSVTPVISPATILRFMPILQPLLYIVIKRKWGDKIYFA